MRDNMQEKVVVGNMSGKPSRDQTLSRVPTLYKNYGKL